MTSFVSGHIRKFSTLSMEAAVEAELPMLVALL
jgi:hypothetical protein